MPLENDWVRIARALPDADDRSVCLFCTFLCSNTVIIIGAILSSICATRIPGLYMCLMGLLLMVLMFVCACATEKEATNAEELEVRTCFLCMCVLFLGLIFMAILIILVFIYKHDGKGFHFRVSNSSLTQFDYQPTSNHTFRVRLSVNVTVSSLPLSDMKFGGISEARAYYQGQLLTNATTSLCLDHDEEPVVSNCMMEFDGQEVVLLSSDGLSRFNEEASSGVYGIDVMFSYYFRKCKKVKDHNMDKISVGSGGFKLRAVELQLKVPISL